MHLVGASPRGWEDVSNVLKSACPRSRASASSCRAASAAPTRPSSSACCASCRPRSTWCGCSPRRPGDETAALLPRTLDGLYGMVYGLLAASSDSDRAGARARDRRSSCPTPNAALVARRVAAARSADAGDGAADAEARWRAGSKRPCSTARPTGATRGSGSSEAFRRGAHRRAERRAAPKPARHPLGGSADVLIGRGAHMTHRGTRAVQRMVEYAPSTGGLALWVRHQDLPAEAEDRRAPLGRHRRPDTLYYAADFRAAADRGAGRPGWRTRCCTSPCAIRSAMSICSG